MLIDDVALRWSVSFLFGLSIAGYVYILVAQRIRWTRRVNHLLHLAMSAAMVVMAWWIGVGLQVVASMGFFFLAALWFVLVAVRLSPDIRDRLTNGYYAVMMAAMMWMYAVMNGSLPGQIGHISGHARSGPPHMEMPGMDTPGPEMSWTTTEPGWITTVNGIATVGFTVAAGHWLYRYFVERRTHPIPNTWQLAHLGLLCQACMAAGTAIMFGVLLWGCT